MRVRYIGKCDKTDSIVGVGLTWTPGQERDVTSTVAAHLLAYTDTWEKADGETGDVDSTGKEPVGLFNKRDDEAEIGFMKKKDDEAELPLPVVDFHSMNKVQLAEYMEKNYKEKVDKRQSVADLRQRATELHTQHPISEADK